MGLGTLCQGTFQLTLAQLALVTGNSLSIGYPISTCGTTSNALISSFRCGTGGPRSCGYRRFLARWSHPSGAVESQRKLKTRSILQSRELTNLPRPCQRSKSSQKRRHPPLARRELPSPVPSWASLDIGLFAKEGSAYIALVSAVPLQLGFLHTPILGWCCCPPLAGPTKSLVVPFHARRDPN